MGAPLLNAIDDAVPRPTVGSSNLDMVSYISAATHHVDRQNLTR